MPEITDSTLVASASAAPVASVPPGTPAPAAAGSTVGARPAAPGRPGRRRLPGHGWYRLVTPVAVVLLWQLVGTAGLVPALKLPPPVTVWRTAVSLVTTSSPATARCRA